MYSGSTNLNFIPDSNSTIFRLSNEESFTPKFYLEGGQKSQKSKTGNPCVSMHSCKCC